MPIHNFWRRDGDRHEHRKRMTYEEMVSYQQSLSRSAAAAKATAVKPTAAVGTTTGPAVAATTRPVLPSNDPKPSTTQPAAVATTTVKPPSSADPVAPSASTRSPVPSNDPEEVATTATTTKPAAQTTKGVATITQSKASSSSHSPTSTATAGAAKAGESTGISNGAIAGIVVALVIGIVAAAALAGMFYRRYKQRNYNKEAPWRQMDNDVTPYRDEQKNISDEDFYGGAPAVPAIGSTRALALARQNAFDGEGNLRPNSEMQNPNFAGYGATRAFGPYPSAPAAAAVATYPVDPHGRAYSPLGHQQFQDYTQGYGHTGQPQYQQYHDYQQNPFDDRNGQDTMMQQNSPPTGPRQLVGPGQQYGAAPVPAPIPLGRPQPPQSYDDIAAAEMYSDDRYADDHMAAPQHYSPHAAPSELSRASPQFAPAPLPTLRPMSPLINAQDSISDADSQRMYHEVAHATGIPEPSGSPFADADMLPPHAAMYQHGQPLSPLCEVPTPKSSTIPLGSSELAGQADRPLPTPRPLPATPPAPREDAYGGI